MKKLFFVLVCFLAMAGFAQADVTFYNTNEATLTWDAVTTDVDGDTIAGVTYSLYIVNAVTDPNKTNPVIIPGITEPPYVVPLTKGKFYVGIQAVLDDLTSEINWADIESVWQTGIAPWGLRFAVPPKAAEQFKK